MRRKILLQSKRGLKSEIMMRNVLNAREWKQTVHALMRNALNAREWKQTVHALMRNALNAREWKQNVLNAREWKRNVQSVNGLNLTLSRLLFRCEPDCSACLGLNQSLDRC